MALTLFAMSDRHETEALVRIERQSRAVLAPAPDRGIACSWEWDVATNACRWNARTFDLLGLPDGIAADLTTFLLQVHPDDRGFVRRKLQAAAAGGNEVTIEYRIVRPNGQIRWLSTQGRCEINARGECQRMLGVHRDVTDDRERANALAETEAVQRAHDAKSEFVARMRLELCTPLTEILGFAQLLALDTTQPLTPRQRLWTAGIDQACKRLMDRAEDVLSLSSIDSGLVARSTEPVALVDVVDDAVMIVAMQSAEAGVAVHGDVSLRTAPMIRADRLRLRHCLVSLLDNAIKFNRAGGKVSIGARSEGTRVALTVADTGQGMDASQLQHLFEPFNRLGAERTHIAGSGIGLAITRRIVEAMEGTINVGSQVGEGTIATLTFPCGLAPARQQG